MPTEPLKPEFAEFESDLFKSQKIIGVTLISSLLVAAIVGSLGSTSGTIFFLAAIFFGGSLLLGIHSFIPWIYKSEIGNIVPDIIYIVAISSMALTIGRLGNILQIFLLVDVAITAFNKNKLGYYFTTAISVASVLVVHGLQGHVSLIMIDQNFIVQLLSVVGFCILFRVLSNETISLRTRQANANQKARQLLAQKKEIYLLIDSISEGIIAVDTHENITLINKAALTVIGITGATKDYVGKKVDQVLVTIGDEGTVSLSKQVFENNSDIKRKDLKIVKHDKTIRISAGARPILSENKEPIGAVILFTDITKENELEEQRVEFLAIASHELRTPLTIIEGYLYYLQTDKSLKYDKKSAEYIDKAYTAAEGLIHLSNDILAVIKSDKNQVTVNLEKIDLEKLLKDISVSLTEKLKRSGNKITINLEAKLPQVISDETKIKETVNNFIENANKFTEKGTISLNAKIKNDKEIIVSVTDNGIGISKTDQTSIFNKFYRTEDWQTRKTGGSGLGLYIAKSYIDRLGGKIGVESEKGKGSTFWFSLPINTKAETAEITEEKQFDDFIKNI